MSITPEEVKANRQRWIEALESGEYQQTRGKLFDGVGYCCLGVACKVLGTPVEVSEIEEDDERWTEYSFEGWFASLPPSVRERLGLKGQSPRINDGPMLITLNDAEGKSFSEIAQLLRQQPDDWTG